MRDIQAFFDGSCEPVNPGGIARWGFALLEDDEVIHTDHGLIGEGDGMTNNVAEYHALLHCLQYLSENHADDFIEIYGDSKMVINMTTGLWGKKKPHKKYPHLLKLLMPARELYSKLDNCSIAWIPRELNAIADALSKQ